MKNFLSHLFIPRSSNNHRARLLHHQILVIFILFFLFSPTLAIHLKNQGVLGVSVSTTPSKLISLTNIQRKEFGLSPLAENKMLEEAASNKAADMFAKNYWAHNAPDGTTPWFFIKKAGYEYVYAGENLAKGFNSAGDVVNAWMQSQEHRDNILSPNFEDVGFAVSEGNLNGEHTTLVVEEFGGKTLVPLQQKIPSNKLPQESLSPQLQLNILGIAPSMKSLTFSQKLTLSIAGIFILVLLLDIVLSYKKKVVRVAGHNLDHILLFIFLLALLIDLFRGATL